MFTTHKIVRDQSVDKDCKHFYSVGNVVELLSINGYNIKVVDSHGKVQFVELSDLQAL
ncbi:hypothetical protein D3C80_803720 [compost metagenome]